MPPYVGLDVVRDRLQIVFPEGVPQRSYCVREAAAATVFTMLYVGAVEGSAVWVGPKQIVRMTTEQSNRPEEPARRAYSIESLKPGFQPQETPWYQENSREQVRDETLRQGAALFDRDGSCTHHIAAPWRGNG